MKVLSKKWEHRRSKFNTLFAVIITLLMITNIANASNSITQQMKMVGQGKMSWLFIDLYKATLYSATGQYKQQHYPQALNILYHKNIAKEHLIRATQQQWQNLDVKEKQSQQWLTKLNRIWPDISKGDELLFKVEEDGSGYFYHNNQLLGAVNNQQFSEAFLAIWLSKNSSEPKLRQQLLGE